MNLLWYFSITWCDFSIEFLSVSFLSLSLVSISIIFLSHKHISCALHFTVCPFRNWTGKHMLHLAQWKNLSRPPTLHMPQPSQWYWFLSSSSKRLHSRHVYLPNRQWQFWQVAWTGWRVSQRTHINSVTSFLFTVCASCSSWQKRHVYTLLQHGV